MTPFTLDQPHSRYLHEQQLGTLATIAPNGTPQNKPVGYRYDTERGTIDISGYEMQRSAKFRNVAVHPQAAFTVQDVPDPSAGADGVRFLELRGSAEQVQLARPPQDGLSDWIIRLSPRRMVSYNVAGPGMHTAEFEADAAAADTRPKVGLSGVSAERAHEAVERQVAELQAGLDDGDAETYNRHFAADVIWGSPYGATVDGYDTLHKIHQRLHASGHRSASRYEVVQVLVLAPDVVLAHVRRDELDDRGEPIPSRDDEARFSEMALYVLTRRHGTWWLAAGQNTKINVDRGAVSQ